MSPTKVKHMTSTKLEHWPQAVTPNRDAMLQPWSPIYGSPCSFLFVLVLSYCVSCCLALVIRSMNPCTACAIVLLLFHCVHTLLCSFHLVSCLAETIKSLCHITILQFVYQNCLALLLSDLRYILTLTLAPCISDPVPFTQTPNSELWTLTPNLALLTYIWNIWTVTEGRHSAQTEANIQHPLPCFVSVKFHTEPQTPNPEPHGSSATAS